jgi:hypothetical protein
MELRAFGLDGAQVRLHSGRLLEYHFSIKPSEYGRCYDCLLKIKPDGYRPDVLVLRPCLLTLAKGAALPHTYPHTGPGSKLCLWWPRRREWMPQMKLTETFIPWTGQWLWYFEDWLYTGEWAGGGVHPSPRRLRRRHRC